MNALYRAVQTSRQALHQYLNRMQVCLQIEAELLPIVQQLRANHPTMGCRDMYFKLQPAGIGRDRFEWFCQAHGLRSTLAQRWSKTTDSRGVQPFDNLTEGLVCTDINQLWQSDITYFEVGARFHYITFIIDAFSRRIVGYAVSRTLKTEQTTLIALQRAIRLRGGKRKLRASSVIMHSDMGGQYYDKQFLALTGACGMQNSMCAAAWENGKAERINGVIKNNYLRHWNINSYAQLERSVDRAVSLYNRDKPHSALDRRTPVAFEAALTLERPNTPTVSETRPKAITRTGKGEQPFPGKAKHTSGSQNAPKGNPKTV